MECSARDPNDSAHSSGTRGPITLEFDAHLTHAFSQLFRLQAVDDDGAAAVARTAFLSAVVRVKQEVQADEYLAALGAFEQEHGHLPNYRDKHEGKALGHWCAAMRRKHVAGRLREELREQLEAFDGWHWRVRCVRTLCWEGGAVSRLCAAATCAPPATCLRQPSCLPHHTPGVQERRRRVHLDAAAVWRHARPPAALFRGLHGLRTRQVVPPAAAEVQHAQVRLEIAG